MKLFGAQPYKESVFATAVIDATSSGLGSAQLTKSEMCLGWSSIWTS